jgi:hypothetical protein
MTSNSCSCSFEHEELDKDRSERIAISRKFNAVLALEEWEQSRGRMTGDEWEDRISRMAERKARCVEMDSLEEAALEFSISTFEDSKPESLKTWEQASEELQHFNQSRKQPTSASWTSYSDNIIISEPLSHVSGLNIKDLLPLSSTPCETCSAQPRPLQLTAQVLEALACSLTCKFCRFLFERFYKPSAGQSTIPRGSKEDDPRGSDILSGVLSAGLDPNFGSCIITLIDLGMNTNCLCTRRSGISASTFPPMDSILQRRAGDSLCSFRFSTTQDGY